MSLPGNSDSLMASHVGSETPTSSIVSLSEGGGSQDPKSIPLVLPKGAAVSAKYRGAFCEALIETVDIHYKLRIQFKKKKVCATIDSKSVVSGNIEPNSEVMVVVNSEDSSPSLQLATILKITDQSLYTVVFDDGDTRCLKRNQLVLKGERHFKESESLDRLPLTNPEQFKQPVIDRSRRYQSSLDEEEERQDNSDDEENGSNLAESWSVADSDAGVGDKSHGSSRRKPSSSSVATPNDHSSSTVPAMTSPEVEDETYRSLLGCLVMIDMSLPSKSDMNASATEVDGINTSVVVEASTPSRRRRYAPGLVVLPSTMPSIDLKSTQAPANETILLVKSFRDNKCCAVPQSCLTVLSRPKAVKLAHRNPTLRTAFERALLWLDRRELPASWGSDSEVYLGRGWDAKDNATEERSGSSLLQQHTTAHHRYHGRQRRRRRHRKASSASSPSSLSAAAVEASPELSSLSSEEVNQSAAPSSSSSSPTSPRHTRKVKQTFPGKAMDSRLASGPSNGKKASRRQLSSGSETPAPGDSDDSCGSDSNNSTSSNSPANFEARDRWIAHLYRFMDERGTPINKAPSIANKDLDLYKLYRVVRRLGGFHRVTSQLKWGTVYSEMDLPHNFNAGPRNLQTAFKKYLFPLDDLSRKLGTNLDEIPISRPRNPKLASKSPSERSSGRVSTSKSSLNDADGNGDLDVRRSTFKSSERAKSPVGQNKSSPPKSSPSDEGKIPQGKPAAEKPSTAAAAVIDLLTSPSERKKISAAPPSSSGQSVVKTEHHGSPRELSSDEKRPPYRGGPLVSPSVTIKECRVVMTSDVGKVRTPRKAVSPCHLSAKAAATCMPAEAASPTELKSPSSSVDGNPICPQRRVAEGAAIGKEPHSACSSPVLSHFEKAAEIDSRSNELPNNSQAAIPIGAVVRVRHSGHSYKAKIMKHIHPSGHMEQSSPTSLGGVANDNSDTNSSTVSLPPTLWKHVRYHVHYAGWNARHDEIIPHERIVSIIKAPTAPDFHRSPSCSMLNLSGGSPAEGDQEGKERVIGLMVDTASDTGTSSYTGQQQRHLMTTHRSKRPRSSSVKRESDTRGAKRAPRIADEDSRTGASFSDKRPVGVSVTSSSAHSTKRRRGHVVAKSSPSSTANTGKTAEKKYTKSGLESGRLPKPRIDLVSPTSTSVVDAATSLIRSPQLLKKLMRRDPVEGKSSGSGFKVERGSKLSVADLEDISSDEDNFPPPKVAAGTPVRRVTTAIDRFASKRGKQLTPSRGKSLNPTKAPARSSSKDVEPTEKTWKTQLPPTLTVGSTDRLEASATAVKNASKSGRDHRQARDLTYGRTPKRPAVAKPRRVSSQAEEGEVSGSSEEEREDSEDGVMATSDALPRLTRNQHRLILGDAPPGVQLQTATANPTTPVHSPSEKLSLSVNKIEDPSGESNIPLSVPPKDSQKKGENSPHPTEEPENVHTPMTFSGVVKPENIPPESGSSMKSQSMCPSGDSIPPQLCSVSLPPTQLSPAGVSPVYSDASTVPMNISIGFFPNDDREDEDDETTFGSAPQLFSPVSTVTGQHEDEDEMDVDATGSGNSSVSSSGNSVSLEEGEEENEEGLLSRRRTSLPPPPPKPQSRSQTPKSRGRLTRGVVTRGRRKRVNSTVVAIGNDDAESIVSSTSSSFRSGRKSKRGRRAGTATGYSSPVLSSPSFPGNEALSVKTPLQQPSSSALQMDPAVGSCSHGTSVRRFGGPYFPIADLDSKSSEEKCILLQRSLCQILEAWRSAKHMLKELDQRSTAATAAAGPGRGGSARRGAGRSSARRPPSTLTDANQTAESSSPRHPLPSTASQ